MTYDLLIKNVRVVRPNAAMVEDADIAISKGKFAKGLPAGIAEEGGFGRKFVVAVELQGLGQAQGGLVAHLSGGRARGLGRGACAPREVHPLPPDDRCVGAHAE